MNLIGSSQLMEWDRFLDGRFPTSYSSQQTAVSTQLFLEEKRPFLHNLLSQHGRFQSQLLVTTNGRFHTVILGRETAVSTQPAIPTRPFKSNTVDDFFEKGLDKHLFIVVFLEFSPINTIGT